VAWFRCIGCEVRSLSRGLIMAGSGEWVIMSVGALSKRQLEAARSAIRIQRSISFEKGVGTTDCTENTDKQGLGLNLRHTCRASGLRRGQPPFQPGPSVKSVVQGTAAFGIRGGNGFRAAMGSSPREGSGKATRTSPPHSQRGLRPGRPSQPPDVGYAVEGSCRQETGFVSRPDSKLSPQGSDA
jgi:hypothetical protein